MSRLPTPGGDEGQWGAILNEYLSQSHDSTGLLKNGSVTEFMVSNGAISESKLSTDLVDRINALEAKLNSYAAVSLSLFGTVPPEDTNIINGLSLELATRFQSSIDGYITAIRFYKGTADTGIHTGTLRDQMGMPISTITFSNETASGWQTQQLPTPVAIAANVPYLVSYFCPTGNFSRTTGLFTLSIENGWLTAPAHSTIAPNGIYREGAGIPDLPAFEQSCYFADIVFSPTV